VSRFLDDKIGPTVARTITGEVHDGCTSTIVLRHRPVMSIATLSDYTGTTPIALTQQTATSLPTNGYILEAYDPTPGLYSGIVTRMASGRPWNFSYGSANVVCTYTAGRVASTTAVDLRIKQAAKVCLKNMWRDREQSAGQFGEFDVPVQNFPTFAMPRAAAELLVKEMGQDETYGVA
jgi:hypothetical protein